MKQKQHRNKPIQKPPAPVSFDECSYAVRTDENTAKIWQKQKGYVRMDGSKAFLCRYSEAEEQKDAPEELAKDEMIRQILREFMA